MHAEFNQTGGLAAIMRHNSQQASKKNSQLEIQDIQPALNSRIEAKLDELPADELAKQALRTKLSALTSSQAFTAAKHRLDDGTTTVHLEKDQDEGHSTHGKKATEPHQIFVDTLTRRINNGLAEDESTEALTQLLDDASKDALSAHSEVREILGALGKLDHNASEYINRSESFVRFGLEQAAAQIGEQEELFAVTDKTDKALNFVIHTNEGDEIKINLSFNSQNRASDITYGQAVSLNYQVEGELSLEEHQAFTELLSAVAGASDALLNGASFNDLIGLEEFDASQLSSFDLMLASSDEYSPLGKNVYQYSYEQNQEEQQLAFSHTITTSSGQSAKVTDMSLSSAIGGAYDEKTIQAILNVVEQADSVAYKHEKTEQQNSQTEAEAIADAADTTILQTGLQTFFKTAERLGEALNQADKRLDDSVMLAKNMFEQISEHDPRYLGIDNNEKDRINKGFSSLVDHHISFNQQKSHSNVAIDFNQETSKSAINGVNGDSGNKVSQTRNYSAEADFSSKQTGYLKPGSMIKDHWQATENYQVSLATLNHSMVGLDQSRQRQEQHNSLLYIGSGQYAQKEMKDEAQASSTIRNVPDLWMEKVSSNNEGYTKTSIYNGRREQDLDANQIYGGAYSKQLQTLSIIGDLNKLTEDIDHRSKKLMQLSQVDDLMAGKRNSIDFQV